MTWRAIPGFDLYEASEDGLIRSWNGGRWGRRREPAVLKARPNRNGYLRVQLGAGNEHEVHRLVCLAFRGLPDGPLEAAHEDGDKLNNRWTNLSWKTRRENLDDRGRHGRMQRGESSHRAKLTAGQVAQIIGKRDAGERPSAIAREFGISAQHVANLCRRRCWKHLEEA